MSAGFGKGQSSGKMPKEMREVIKQGWEEMTGLRQDLIGQFMGMLTGQGPMSYETVGATPGHYETQRVRTGSSEGEGGPDIYEDRQVWVPGEPGRKEWVPSGQPGMQAPIIAQAEDAQRRATARAMRESETGLARQGLVGTPFGENILAQQRQTGAQAFAGIAPGIIGQFLQMIPGYTQGSAQSIMGALPGTRETSMKQWNASGGTAA